MELNEAQLQSIISQAITAGISAAGSKSYGYKAPAATPTTNLIHGPGGIFGIAGLDNQVISARITPRGISEFLRAVGTVYTNPQFPYITGIEEDAGNEPSTECATCLSGEIEGCIQTAQFGRICRETKTLAPNEVIERVNSGEVDLQLMNDILGFQGDVMAAVRNYDRSSLLQIATATAMLVVGALLQAKLVPMWWQGNPANNVGTGYAEFPGLSILVGTGKVDANTNTTCPALDSDVKEFNYQLVSAVDAAGNFRIVQQLSYLEAYLYHNATRMNLSPVSWAVVMRPELWYELTNVWPIAYLSTRGFALPAGNTNFIDAGSVRDRMDAMLEGQFLFINGRRHPVILDDGIFENNSTNDANLAAGEFASDIYMIPMTYLGGRPATFIQHKDYRGARRELREARYTDDIWTDDGRFLWTHERLKWCYTLSGKVEPRIILKTPQLAGRLNHVRYVPAQHLRDFDQDSDYFYKGGESSRTAATYYSEWD
jgi:hypothetical protein